MLGAKNSASDKFLQKQWSLCPDCWFSAEKIIMSPSFGKGELSRFFVCFWQKILLGKRIWTVLSVMSDHHRCCGAWNEARGQMLNTLTWGGHQGCHLWPPMQGHHGKVCGISPFHLLGLPAPEPELHVCVVGRKSDLGPVSSRCQVVLTGLASMVSPFFPGQDSGRWRESCLLWTSC